MNANQIPCTRRRVTRVLIATAAVLVLGAAAIPAAWADGPRIGISLSFVIPGHIFVGDAPDYAPYYAGDAVVAPYGNVVVYRFPVETAYGVIYRPYAYCDGRLIGIASGPAYRRFYYDGPSRYGYYGNGGPYYDQRYGHRYDGYRRYDNDHRWNDQRYGRGRHGQRDWHERNYDRDRDRD